MPDSVEIPPPPLETVEHIAPPPPPAYLDKTSPLASGAWVLYDTANTVYAAVLTFIFAPYLGDLFGGRSIQGITNSASMVAAGLCVPVFASLADHTGRARLYLIITTLACIGGMATFGLTSVPFLVMAAFFVANFGYNAALVFYNSLLPSVAADKHQGLVSGLGVGCGYVGTIIIVVLLGLPKAVGFPATFGIAAAIFLALALPCFVLVRERRVQKRTPFSLGLVKRQFGEVFATVKSLPKDRPVMWFLIGNFFCVDVLNTAILYFGDFTRGTFFVNSGTPTDPVWIAREGASLAVFGLAIDTPTQLLTWSGLSLNVLALVFGITLGFMTDRWGSLRVLRLSAAFLALGLIGAAVGGGFNLTLYLAGICGFGALGLAGIWTAGRKLLIELSPRERLGEYFGLYGITTKLSVLGSAVFGLVFDTVSAKTGNDLYGWKAALSLQAAPLLFGLLLLALVKKPGVTASATS
ncbi:MAG: MFS transporter [Planctomycetes bacterium]|nr:MFS transporter [Planctomycetota bacterium]